VSRVMLGIDPGLQCTGWGLVSQSGQHLHHVAHGTVRTNPAFSDALRLREIHDGLAEVVSQWQPHAAAIESIFVARGAASAIKLGMARGVAMQLCSGAGLSLAEVAARQVKKAVTGTGKADKKQVQAMVDRLLGIRSHGADAADALAIAIAALNQGGLAGSLGSAAGASPAGDGQPGRGLAAAIEAALARDAQGGRR
jgi:crossover junction endodeoxyribonuclease RuvC